VSAELIPEKMHRWSVVRIERLLGAQSGREPSDIGAADVEEYLQAAGRSTQVPGFCWDYWLASVVELEADHPTVARHNHPVLVDNRDDSASHPALYPDIEIAPIAAIRLKNHSIRPAYWMMLQ